MSKNVLAATKNKKPEQIVVKRGNKEYLVDDSTLFDSLMTEYPEGNLISYELLCRTRKQLDMHRSKLSDGISYTFRDLSTEEHWESLSEYERFSTNCCVAYLIKYEEYPLKVIGYLFDSSLLYQFK